MKNNIDNLIGKQLSGNASAEELLEIKAWTGASKENERYFNELQSLWNTAGSLKEEPAGDVDAAWDEFRELTQRPAPRVFHLRPLRIAAAVALFVCTFFAVRYFVSGSRDTVNFANNVASKTDTVLESPFATHNDAATPDTTPEIKEPVKHKPFVKRKNFTQLAMIAVSSEDSAMVLTLPDLSKVYLNRNSKLTYAENFTGANRVVHLSGEAYFEVAEGNSPFFVYCRDTKSRSMAAAFNVSGYEDREIEVSVLDGLVEVTKVSPSQTRIIIGKGEKVAYNALSEQFLQAKASKKERWWKRISFRTKIKNFINRIIHRS
jgi:transmembrane sensor